MKYRQSKIKREHSIIKGLFELLQNISHNADIKSIIPGRINPISGNYPEPVIEVKYVTDSGLKCIAKSGRSAQEVFIVTDFPDRIKAVLGG
ncbi:MAG: DUF2103 domain-containing protein [Candidatus Dojkabacteria bacterium]